MSLTVLQVENIILFACLTPYLLHTFCMMISDIFYFDLITHSLDEQKFSRDEDSF